MKQKACLICAALCAVHLVGCTKTTLKTKNGDEFSRTSFGTKTSIGELSVSGDTNGVRTISLKSYANDQVQAMQAITEAAVSAALKGAKP